MQTNTVQPLDNFTNPDIDEKWINITLKVKDVINPYEAQWVPNSAASKVRQAGILEDCEGETCPFINWTNSEQPEVSEGDAYQFKDLFLVYGKKQEDFKIIFRSDTYFSKTDSFNKSPVEQTSDNTSDGGFSNCPSCSASISDSDVNNGPEHPEIGWEYVECGSCSEVFRPEVLKESVGTVM